MNHNWPLETHVKAKCTVVIGSPGFANPFYRLSMFSFQIANQFVPKNVKLLLR